MSNRVAAVIFGVIVFAILADVVLNDFRAGVFLGRKFLDLTDYIAFWR